MCVRECVCVRACMRACMYPNWTSPAMRGSALLPFAQRGVCPISWLLQSIKEGRLCRESLVVGSVSGIHEKGMSVSSKSCLKMQVFRVRMEFPLHSFVYSSRMLQSIHKFHDP